jgi:hypothetical protein
MRSRGLAIILVLSVMGTGCGREAQLSVITGVEGEPAKPDAYLAYEHEVVVEIEGSLLHDRAEAVREACSEGTFGDCRLLEIEERTGAVPGSKVMLRMPPEGIAPMTAFAGEGGSIVARTTRAQDLAQAVADTARQKSQLEARRKALMAFQARGGLSVSDAVVLTKELASIESELEEVERAAATQQRRIQTNRLTIRFDTGLTPSPSATIKAAITGAGDSLARGTAEAIETAAAGLPYLILGFPLALLWRYLWRKATSSRTSPRP